MKKYRLKEEVKKYFTERYFIEQEQTLDEWRKGGFNLEALEEVEEKIELVLIENKWNGRNFIQASWQDFTSDDVRLCEAILNASESTKEAILDEKNSVVVSRYIKVNDVKEVGYVIQEKYNISLNETSITAVIQEYLKTK